MKKTLALIQARMSSTRFPGKVLQPLLNDVPLIVFMAQRVRQAACISDLVIATSDDPSDDPLENILRIHGLRCFRGSLNDVLDRFYQAAKSAASEYVVRLTGDCPLIDPQLIDQVLAALKQHAADYASNIDPPTFPDGLDVECFSFAALERAWREAQLPSEREHVTPFIRQRKDLFRGVNVSAVADFSQLRWTVDYPDDLQLVHELLRCAGARHPTDCDRFDFLRIIETNPNLREFNKHVRNEGYIKSLMAEQKGA